MKKITLYTLLALVMASLSAAAQQATSEFNVDGIKVIFKPSPKTIVDVQMYFRGGVANYPADKAGIETLTLDALTQCGTKKYEANNFKDIADNFGISLFGNSTYDYGVVRLNCISKYFDQGWDLLTDAVNNPVFDAAQLELLKNKIITHNRYNSSSAAGRLHEITMQNAFGGTPYAIDPEGTEESLQKLSAADLAAYYKSIFNKNRIFIVVVGNLTKEQLIGKIHASFAALPSAPYTPGNYNTPLWSGNHLVAEKRSLAINYLAGIMNCPPMKSPLYVPFRMGVAIMSGQMFLRLRTKLNLTYDPSASAYDYLMPFCRISASTNDPEKTVEEMVALVKQVKKINPSDEFIEHIKSNFITTNYIKEQSTGAVADNLGEAEINGGWQLEDTFADRVNAVTGTDINKALNSFLLGIRWNYLGNTDLAAKAKDAFSMPIIDGSN